MSIWIYRGSESDSARVRQLVACSSCIYCSAALETLHNEKGQSTDSIRLCRVCGWWYLSRGYREGESVSGYLGMGTLCELDFQKDSAAIVEIRTHLAARYEERFSIDPFVFEEVVASVYRDLGYSTWVTGRHSDGGIDILLSGPEDTRIGVQVKRYKNAIKVEQIRSLVGALVLKGITKGIFVTTSTFQSGARTSTQLAAIRGCAVELVDAEKFFSVLGMVQRSIFRSADDPMAPWNQGRVNVVLNFHESRPVEPDDPPYMFP